MGFIQLPEFLCFIADHMHGLCCYPDFHQVSSLLVPSCLDKTYQVHTCLSAHAFSGDFCMVTDLLDT